MKFLFLDMSYSKWILETWILLVTVLILIPIEIWAQFPSTDGLTTSFDYYEMRREFNPRVLETIDQGLRWLEIQQGSNGLFHNHLGITALVIAAFLKHPEKKYSEATHQFIRKSINVLIKNQNPDDSICDLSKEEMAFPSYTTSVSLIALAATENNYYHSIIKDARNFLKSLQMADDLNNRYYGGISYGNPSNDHYDLSNLSFAIQALEDTNSYAIEVLPEEEPADRTSYRVGQIVYHSRFGRGRIKAFFETVSFTVRFDRTGEKTLMAEEYANLRGGYNDKAFFVKAVQFIERCQSNRNNSKEWAEEDRTVSTDLQNHGGFVYSSSGESKTGTKGRPYGSMAYAGLLGLIHAGISEDDDLIQGVYEWIRKNYTVEVNPGMDLNKGQQGIYYYYYTMATSLAAFEKIRTTMRGRITETKSHFWFKDLAEKLIELKIKDVVVARQDIPDPARLGQLLFKKGDAVELAYWRNKAGQWMERDTVLVTAYAILALEAGLSTE